VAFVVFLLVKGINSIKREEAAAEAPPPGPTPTETLLTEIRDLLKAR
jgi:large conductance mechanosensitive channel